jgi:hypothetical protein
MNFGKLAAVPEKDLISGPPGAPIFSAGEIPCDPEKRNQDKTFFIRSL